MSDPHRHDEFVSLLAQHRSQLFGYIYALLRNMDDAEDVYQDTAVILWRKFDEFCPDTHFIRWACTVARNRIANFVKKKQRRGYHFSIELQEELADVQASVPSAEAAQCRDALVHCVALLPQVDRHLLDLCYGGDCRFKEVASKLGRTSQSIYDALSRIRRRLLKCVELRIRQDEHPGVRESRA